MDPTRLLEEDDTHFEARLLRTARRDDPPPEAMNRAAVALGLGVSASAAATATATAVAKAATGHVAAAHTVGTLGAASLAKWVGIGVMSGLVVTGGVRYASDPLLRASLGHGSAAAANVAAAERTVKTRDSAARLRAEERVPEEPARAVAPSLSPETEAARAPLAAPRVPHAPGSSGAAEAAGASPNGSAHVASLSSELVVLERARRALVAHDPDAVLRELGTYISMPHTAVLEAEAEMLAIEALVQRGDTAKAAARAARALETPQNGPHAARLREIVTAGEH
jgi:hypothetical protein